MRRPYLLLLLSLIAFSSCSTSRSGTTRFQNITSTHIIQHPLLVDLDVEESKVQGTASGSESEIKNLKAAAVLDAVEKSNADVLIQPSYTIQSKAGGTTVTAEGWPASYKNFRKVTPADSVVLSLESSRPIYSRNAEPEVVKKKRGGAAAILLILGIAAAAVFSV